MRPRVAVPTRPAASRTVATIACGPLATREESQGSVTWLPLALAVASVVPPIDSVNVRGPAAAPSTQMSDHTTPPTTAPAGGLVMNTRAGALRTMRRESGGPDVPDRVAHRRRERDRAIRDRAAVPGQGRVIGGGALGDDGAPDGQREGVRRADEVLHPHVGPYGAVHRRSRRWARHEDAGLRRCDRHGPWECASIDHIHYGMGCG